MLPHALPFLLQLAVSAHALPPAPHPFPPHSDPTGILCAEQTILKAAKKNVADQFGNSPSGSGLCAYGVRTSLQQSRVGGVNDGLGNAIDYINSLPPKGFVDTGIKDPLRAPAGSVLVFSGPKTPQYFDNGEFGSPAGDWVGHVTIKGDDGRYYTDGRTVEPALGWVNGRNVSKTRNIAGIYVPGPELSTQWVGRCLVQEKSAPIVEDDGNLTEGRRRIAAALALLAGPRKREELNFLQVLNTCRENVAFDEEARLRRAVAKSVQADLVLRGFYESYMALQPRGSLEEHCRSERFYAAMEEALCLEASKMRGQDEAGSRRIVSCLRPFRMDLCLKN